MATSNDEWDVGMQNGLRPSVVPPEPYEPMSSKPKSVGAVVPGTPKPGQPANRPPVATKPGRPGAQHPGQGGSLKPGQPGPKPHRPGTPRPDGSVTLPDVPGTRPGTGPRPGTGIGAASQLTRFEGMRVKLRKAASGRYALGVDVELALDDRKPGIGQPSGGRPGGSRPGGPKPGRPRPRPQMADEAEDLEAFAVPDEDDMDLEAFVVPDPDGDDEAVSAAGDDEAGYESGAELAGDDGSEADAAFGATEPDDGAELAGDGESEGEAGMTDDDADDAAFAAAGDDEGMGDEAGGDEGDEAFAGADDEGDAAYAAGEDVEGDNNYDGSQDTDDAAFASDDDTSADVGDDGELGPEAASAAIARWPNRFPVPKGVFSISQAPAIFETQESDDEQLTAQAAAKPGKPAKLVGTAAGMVAAAKRTIGMGEHPPGSDHNKITEWYNANIARIGNGPWCNMAVTYWAGHSRNLAAIFGGRNIGYAYTVAHAQKFVQKKRWHNGVAGIRPGDIVFFAWSGPRTIRNIDHVGVVEKVKGRQIVTIEGNTTGESCRRQVRDPRFIVGYGRPAYGR